MLPELEGGLREANIDHSLVQACDFSVIDDVGRQAVPLEGAEVLVSAGASFIVGLLVFFQGLLVVGFDDAGNVRHAAVYLTLSVFLLKIRWSFDFFFFFFFFFWGGGGKCLSTSFRTGTTDVG